MATIYLHIGAPKTATSTLQSVLAKNAGHLLKQGILYPQSMRNGHAHHLLACDLIAEHQGMPMPDVWYGDQPRGAAWGRLSQELSDAMHSVESVVLSSELFFGQHRGLKPLVQDIQRKLDGHDVRIIVYLRRQDDFYSSFYNQDVKGVRQWAGSAYEFYETHQMLRHHYDELLASWGSVFGSERVIVRPYEIDQWQEGDIVRDFSALVPGMQLKSKSTNSNEGLGPTQLYLKLCLNRIGYEKAENTGVLEALHNICGPEESVPCQYVNRALYAKLRDRWMQANEFISDSYLGGASLFQHNIPLPTQVTLYQLDAHQLELGLRNTVRVLRSGEFANYRALFASMALLVLAEKSLWHCLDPQDRADLLSWVA